MAVVDGGDAADGAGRVVEDALDHVRLDAEPRAIGRARTSGAGRGSSSRGIR